MHHSSSAIRPKAKLVRAGYPSRITACLVALGVHLSLFYQTADPVIWLFVIFHTLIYPHAVYYLSASRQNEQRNIQIDGFLYGGCIALWGFNPLLITVYISGMCLTVFAAGGRALALKSVIMAAFGMLIGAQVYGAYYRESLPLAATLFAALGLLGFSASVGLSVYKINTTLINARRKLSIQKEQLIETSDLAYAVNLHLELDKIMETVIDTLRKLHPFEQVYITLLDDNRENLNMIKSYGNALSHHERRQFEGLTLSLAEDQNSIFVIPILTGKPLYIPRLNEKTVARGSSAMDQRLYRTKPSVSIANFPLYVENHVIGCLGFVNYTTPLNITNEEIQRMSDYLLQVGTAVRNARLLSEAQKASDEALVALKVAEASEAAKSNFLANMSHEIRTPMTAIIGYSECLRNDQLSTDDKHHFVETIIRSGNHLLTIINDILDLSKIEAHKLEVTKVNVKIASLIRDIQAHINLQAEEKNLIFNISPIFPLPSFIVSDPTRLKQILFNLAGNAIKFTNHGSVNILIRYEDESDTIYFEVKDTGIGLTPEQQQKAFEPFIQGDASTTRKYGGAGLGLYISRHLAHILGGEIYVDSQPGLGSEFVLALHPGNLSDTNWYRNQIELDHDIQGLNSTLFPIDATQLEGHILVAEDNIENQQLIEHLLTGMGIDITLTNNGLEALEAMQDHTYDMVMLDIQMPEMGGEEAAPKIKQIDASVPIIAITANVMQHQIDNYRKAGFIDFIAKPFDRKHLFQVLKKHMLSIKQTHSGNLLIAEDNPVNLKLLTRLVQSLGSDINITAVTNGVEVLDALSNASFDLMLIDMEMPVMNGIEALIQLRKEGNETPVYIVTGNVDSKDVEYCLKVGATGHIAKPIDQKTLQSICNDHLQQAKK